MSREKFFAVGGLWIAVMEGESLPSRTYNHIAFKIPASAIDGYRQRIEALGLEIRESRPRVEGEGQSLYFYDAETTISSSSSTRHAGRRGWTATGRARRSVTTRAQALAELRRTLNEAGFETAALDARLAASDGAGHPGNNPRHASGYAPTAEESETLASFARRRLAHEPVARIVGIREFWGLPFRLSPETLVPRPDTETVVETVLDLLPDRQAPLRIVDFGTGSGCILVALLHELPRATGLGIDLSPGALATARTNAGRERGRRAQPFRPLPLGRCGLGPFDLIVSNPPYIASGVIPPSTRRCASTTPVLPSTAGRTGSNPTGSC